MIFECKINFELVWLCYFCVTTIKLFDLFDVSDGVATECGPDEKFNERGPSCQMTCAGLNQHCCINNFVAPSACYCIDGYARRKSDKKCIPISSQPCQDEAVPAEPIDCDARWPANGYWSYWQHNGDTKIANNRPTKQPNYHQWDEKKNTNKHAYTIEQREASHVSFKLLKKKTILQHEHLLNKNKWNKTNVWRIYYIVGYTYEVISWF